MALLALVSYVPLLLTRPGQVGADTKTYLYLDPGRLLSRAPYMWDPNIGFGTVTHQNIGYLWPMGPYYFAMDAIGLPDWVAQRLWLGSIILMAGLGVRFMLRELRWRSAGVTVAAFAYALSPYLIDYGARISVILLPFAGLPWLIGLAARSLRRQDWRTPAIFALVTLTVGGVNATSLLLVMVGPMVWFLHATFVEKEVRFRQALMTALRITVLTAITSIWWVVGLLIQGAHGIPILRYTETYETVANAALAPELLRGLGYWFFYGTDGLGAWTEASKSLIESPPLLVLSFALPLAAFVAALLTRFRHRIFFATIVLIGLVIGVGSHPWDSPSPYGAIFKAFSTSDLGLSFRSTPRAVPLIALGLAVFLGAGLGALSRWRPAWHRPAAAVLLVLICCNQLPLFRGQMVDRNLVRDEDVPSYWEQAGQALDQGDRSTRVLEMPGIDFASYRWGNTVDPITPGLTDREYVARELIPYGSPPSANLLNDVDMPFQSGRVEPAALAPLARLMGVGDVLLRGDLQYERYRTPRPRQTYAQLREAPGLEQVDQFGDPVPNEASDQLPLDDEMEFGMPSTLPDPAPVTLFRVKDPRDVLRTVQASAPTIVSGDAAGLVSLAALGGLGADRPVFYSASYADDPSALQAQVDEPDAQLVVTDTNRRQARRWGSVRENDGYTERAGETPLVDDNTDNRLDVFPEEGDDQRTVTVQEGGATIAASAYGNGVTYTAGDRAMKAMDGDPSTSWKVAAFADPVDEFLQIRADEPVTTDHIDLLQVQGGANRSITKVSLSFDGGAPEQVALDDASRTAPGQRVEFPERTFRTLRITIDATDRGPMASYKGISGVGFAEVTIPGIGPISEVVRPPTDLLDTAGSSSLDRALSYVFTRRASNPGDVIAADEEPTMRRIVAGPVERAFTVFGKARLTASLPDTRVDSMIGLPDATAGGVTATSSERLPGDPGSRASAAVDGDAHTAYQTPVNSPMQWLEFTYAQPVTVDDLTMSVIADGKHSIPTAVTVSVDGGPGQQYQLPAGDLGDGADRGTTRTLTVPTGELTGTTFRITVDAVQEAASKDWFGGQRTVLPVGIAEVGLPVVAPPADDTPVSDACRTDLATLGGTPVALQVVGTVGQALNGESMDLRACPQPGASTAVVGNAVTVPAGETLLETAPGADTGLDVDLLSLASGPGGIPGTDTLASPPDDGPTPPASTTERTGRNSYEVRTTGADQPYWVVLGQSYGPGWVATTSDGKDLGEPTLVNGFANGWRVDPADVGADTTIRIHWAPQRFVWFGLALSAIGVVICLVLVAVDPRRRRGGRPSREEDDDHEDDQEDLAPAEPADAGSVDREADAVVGDMEPIGTSPFAVDGTPLGWLPAVLGALVAGAVGFLVGGVVIAAVVAVVAAVSLGLRRGQLVVRVACIGMLGLAFAYIVAKQLVNSYQIDFDWVQWFEITHDWALLATVLLAVDVAVDGVRRSVAVPTDATESTDQTEPA